MEENGMERNGTEWNGMERNGTEWNKNGTEYNITEWKCHSIKIDDSRYVACGLGIISWYCIHGSEMFPGSKPYDTYSMDSIIIRTGRLRLLDFEIETVLLLNRDFFKRF